VTLTRGRRSETVGVVELGAEESLPVLRQYLREVRVARPYFDVNEDSPPEAFMAGAPRHRCSGSAGLNDPDQEGARADLAA
jgi:hypothetical protein